MEIRERVVGSVTVLDVEGRLVLGEGDKRLRDAVDALVRQGRTRVLLNLAAVPLVDSAGLGQIVRTHTTLMRQRGRLRLLHADKRMKDLLSITKLITVFELFDDESEALKDFSQR